MQRIACHRILFTVFIVSLFMKSLCLANAATEGRTDDAVGAKPSITSSVIDAKFILIPSGTFMMGTPIDEPGRDSYESNQYQVTISRAFYMQTTEITQGQWKIVMGNNPSRFSDCGNDCPVEQVSWNDTQEFINKLNSMEGTDQYRLPTEAEWEYAARAGTKTPFHTGTCLTTDQANYNGDYPLSGCPKGQYRERTVRVGSFAPNAWGLYDMHGNVWEWVQDRKGNYPTGSMTDPEGPSSGAFRICRGGSWNQNAWVCRSSFRFYSFPSLRKDHRGFRLVGRSRYAAEKNLITVYNSQCCPIPGATKTKGGIPCTKPKRFDLMSSISATCVI